MLPFSDGDFAFDYLTPDLSVRKERSISRQAHLYFVVSRWDIRPELGDNLEELGKITTAFRELADDEDISISSISIDGYASPEGPHDFNILHDGTSYEIPLLGINFKLNPGNLSLKDRNGLDSLLLFNREGQTMDVPYICSPNVERIEAMLPADWSMRADISPTDSTKRIIHLTAPQLMDLDRSQFEGGATFIAFDQKGAAVTQFIKLKLKKYMYINFFYNPLNSVETNRPTSPLNSIGFPTVSVCTSACTLWRARTYSFTARSMPETWREAKTRWSLSCINTRRWYSTRMRKMWRRCSRVSEQSLIRIRLTCNSRVARTSLKASVTAIRNGNPSIPGNGF